MTSRERQSVLVACMAVAFAVLLAAMTAGTDSPEPRVTPATAPDSEPVCARIQGDGWESSCEVETTP